MKKSIYISLLILAFGGGYFLGNNQFLTRSLYTKTHGAGDHIVGTRSKNVTSHAVQKRKASLKKHKTGSNFQSATYCPDKGEFLQEPPIPPHEISDQQNEEGDEYSSTEYEYAILEDEMTTSMVEGQIPEEDIQNVLDGLTPEEICKDMSSISAQGDRSAEEIEEDLRKSLSEEAGASPKDIENMIKGFIEATRMQEQETEHAENAPLPTSPPNEDFD